MDLAKVVCTRASLRLDRRPARSRQQQVHRRPTPRFHVVAYDFGVKRNILRMLAERGCKRDRGAGADQRGRGAGAEAGRRVPVQRPGRSGALRLRDRRDPRIHRGKDSDLRHLPRPPVAGAGRPARSTLKMKFGHHGANHPVHRPRQRPGDDHLAEPRLRGRRSHAAGQRARDPSLAVRRHRTRASS